MQKTFLFAILGLIVFIPVYAFAVEPSLTIPMVPGQTTNPWEIKDSAGNIKFSVSPNGTITGILSPINGNITISKSGFPNTEIDAGSGISSNSYVISIDGSKIFAKNGTTGQIVFSGTNPTTIIQQSINSLTSGGNIFIKSGTYHIPTRILVNQTKITLSGEGDATLLQESNGVNLNNIIKINSNDTTIQNIKLDGNFANNPTGLYGVAWGSGVRFVIDHVTIINTGASGIDIELTSPQNLDGFVSDNKIINPGTFGIIDVNGSRLNIYDNFVQNSGRVIADMGIKVKTGTHVLIHGNTIIGDYNGTTVLNRFGIQVSRNSNDVSITNNIVNSVADDGITVDHSKKITIANNILDNIASPGIGVTNGSSNIAVVGNVVNGSTVGVYLSTVKYNVTDVTITGNTITNSKRSAIEIEASPITTEVRRVVVSDNVLTDNVEYGVHLINTLSKNVYINSNVMNNNILGDVNANATASAMNIPWMKPPTYTKIGDFYFDNVALVPKYQNTLNASRQFIIGEVQQEISGVKKFFSTALHIRNPATTHEYILAGAALTSDLQINLPISSGNTTLPILNLNQTWTGKQSMTPTAGQAGINIGPNLGSNPTSLADGDVWEQGGQLKYRNSGAATKTLAGLESANSFSANQTIASGDDLVMGTSNRTTSSTHGFIYIPVSDGTPTGTVGTHTGTVAMEYDGKTNRICVFNGSWKCVTLS